MPTGQNKKTKNLLNSSIYFTDICTNINYRGQYVLINEYKIKYGIYSSTNC